MEVLSGWPRAIAAALALTLAGCSLVLDSESLQLGGADVANPDTRDSTSPDEADGPDAPDADTDGPGAELIVRHSGENGCTLSYRSLLSCPTSCDWQLVVDAGESRGVGSFAWRFSATGAYRVSPQTATGERVTLTLDTPACDPVVGVTVGPAKVLAEVSLDGGPYRIGASIDFTVQQVSQCPTSDLCPAPP